VEEQTVAGAAHVKGHALVALIGLAREGVAIDDGDLPPALVQGRTLVTKSIDALAILQLEAGDAFAVVDLPIVDQDLVATAQLERKNLILQG
jgi:hypothetical protein